MTITAFFIALAFVSNIANRLYSKYTLNRLDTYAVTLLSNAACAIFLFPVLWYMGNRFSFSLNEWVFVISLGTLWTLTAWVMNASIAQNDFSFKEIIRQTRVLMVVFGGIFILGETVNRYDGVGILFIVLSVFVISYKKFTFKDHISSKPILLAWLSAFLVAIIALLEKSMFLTTDVGILEYSFFAFGIPALFLLLFMNAERVNNVNTVLKESKLKLVLFSSLMLIVYCASLAVFKMLPISIAYPLIQSSSVISVLIGTWMFEENKQAGRKFFAAMLAITGVIIIQLF